MRNNFVQLFDIKSFERVHLKKDVGMIPALLHKKYNMNSTIVFYDNEKNHDLEEFEEGINLRRIKTDFTNKLKLLEFVISPMILYLIKNAKEIDYLMLFHLKKQNYFYRFIYKLFNPKGKIYLKIDLDTSAFKGFQIYKDAEIKDLNLLNLVMKPKENFVCLKRKLGFKFLKQQLTKFDIISAETKDAVSKINEATSDIIKSKLIYITNGFSETEMSMSLRKPYVEKENIIITVGRIGSNQKNNEMFLKAIEKLDLKDWEIYFIGPIEDKFYTKINEFYESNTNLTKKVHFIGNVSNKSELYSWYARSKIFCLTSRHEGFPLVFPEAIYFGNYIISTKVGADKDITADGVIGTSVELDDFENLAQILQNIIDNESKLDGMFQEIVLHCKNNYMWNDIIDTLYEKLVLS